MDFNAIQFADDSILEEYGLKAAGQRLSLRWFCQTQIQGKSATAGSSIESKEMRKQRLLEELRKKSKRNGRSCTEIKYSCGKNKKNTTGMDALQQ